jgi:hypothetical protein
MKDYKHATRYPVELTQAQHDKRSEAADLLALLLAVAVFAFWGGYELARDHSTDQVATAAVGSPYIGECPSSTLEQDVVEHAWLHRGELFYRECLVLDRPVHGQPARAYAKGL